MSKTIDLNTDNKTKEQLKSAEFIRVDDVVFVRKDHVIDILNRVVDDRKNKSHTIDSNPIFCYCQNSECLHNRGGLCMTAMFNCEDRVNSR